MKLRPIARLRWLVVIIAGAATACTPSAPGTRPPAGGADSGGEEQPVDAGKSVPLDAKAATVPADASVPPDLNEVPPDGPAATVEVAPDGPPPGPPASASEACGMMLPVPAEGQHELPVGGEARKFLLRLPSGYDGKKPWPVIFVFHGAGQSQGYFDGNTDLRAQTEEKAILVLPDGPVKPDGRRSWVFRSPDNVLFVDALVAWLKKSLCIDPSRLFATGLSSGGYMSVTLACQRGDVFKAVATCSGGMVEHENCKGSPTVWLRTGSSDTASTVASVTMARDFWIQHKGCEAANPRPIEPAPCVSYGGCTDGTAVVFCKDSGGHGWPSYFSKAIWGAFSAL